MRGALAIAALVGMLVAAPAQGATVRVEPVYGPFDCVDRVFYEGAPGEFNEVHVQGASDTVSNPFPGPFCGRVVQTVEVSETYHRLFAGPGCRQLTARSAVCASAGRVGDADPFLFRLGDRDDLLSFAVPDAIPAVSCGAGIDYVVGPADADPDCEFVNP